MRRSSLWGRMVWGLVAWGVVGCQARHYVVDGQAPVYDRPNGDFVGYLPSVTHGPLGEEADWIEVDYDGERGYVRPEDVQVYTYTDPYWDGGVDRSVTLDEALRLARLRELERGDAPEEVLAAARLGELRIGMDTAQIEAVWGWPDRIEPGEDGRSEWVYRRPRWFKPSELEPLAPPLWRSNWVDHWQSALPGPGAISGVAPHSGARLLGVEERILELSAEGTLLGGRLELYPGASWEQTESASEPAARPALGD